MIKVCERDEETETDCVCVRERERERGREREMFGAHAVMRQDSRIQACEHDQGARERFKKRKRERE